MEFVSRVREIAGRYGFDHLGCVPLGTPLSLLFYREWLAAGHHGDMEYLQRHLAIKEHPNHLAPRARSAIVVAKNYFPHPYPSPSPAGGNSGPTDSGPRMPQRLRTALYAKGADYHFAFKKELNGIVELLKEEFQSEEFLCFTDSAPLLERDLAAQAGLGWIGKNSCVIHPRQGSLFFIGEILTSHALESRASMPIPDYCGTCDRCLKACPTQALESPRVLNANKCISYWTIEAKSVAPLDLVAKFGDWFFGCDICQTVCPWNEKAFGKETMRSLARANVSTTDRDSQLIQELRFLLTTSNKGLAKAFAGLPYSRARSTGLKRNALYVIGNLRLKELRSEVEAYLSHDFLAQLARWTLIQLEVSGEDKSPGADALNVEADDDSAEAEFNE